MLNAIKKIKDLTDNNEHTEARLAGAELLNDELLINTYTGIINAHQTLGYMSDNLLIDRALADGKMNELAKANMTPDQYKEFHNSF